MPYLVSILIASLIFFGFLLFTYYESRRGTRFFAASRYRLDKKVARMSFLLEHVDWGAFTAHVTKASLQTVAHDTAHASLIAVRAVERFLTRAVSALRRSREGIALSSPSATRLGTTVTNLTTNLRRRAPSATDIIRREKEGE